MEINNMNIETQIAELTEKVQAMQDCSSATKEAYAQLAELKDRVVSLETELSVSKSAYDELFNSSEAVNKNYKEEMMKKEEEMKKAKSDLDSAIEAIAGYKGKEEEMMKKEKKMKRMASLIEKGLDQEVASSAVDNFESLEDSAFEAMVELVSSAAKKAQLLPKKKVEAEQSVEDILDNVEPNSQDLDLSAGGDESESVDTTRAALVDFVCARLGKKLNKGE
jgi:hypothetical protein